MARSRLVAEHAKRSASSQIQPPNPLDLGVFNRPVERIDYTDSNAVTEKFRATDAVTVVFVGINAAHLAWLLAEVPGWRIQHDLGAYEEHADVAVITRVVRQRGQTASVASWFDNIADAYIDAGAGVDAATAAYRYAHADPDVETIAFDGVWLAHPTWITALNDECWTVDEEPANKSPGSRAVIRRKPTQE